MENEVRQWFEKPIGMLAINVVAGLIVTLIVSFLI
ncbi:hypothetical protein VSWAT3_00843 [Vibrionales bacterium SWAT-3]|nr:hypothetical protein VSWAT3_00843 [Vibrionales bacterium SWAT-3]